MAYTPTVNANTLELYLGICATGQCTASSTALTNVSFGTPFNPSSITFTPDDVGMPIAIAGGGPVDAAMPPINQIQGALFVTTIAAYVSPTEVTLAAAPDTSYFNAGFANIVLYRPCPFASDQASVPTQFQFASSIAPGTADTLQFSVLNSLGGNLGVVNPYVARFGALQLGQPVYLKSSDPDVGDIFGGYIDTLTTSSQPGISGVYCWSCQCVSWTGLAKRRIVPPATPQTFTDAAGDAVFRAIVLDYLIDDGVSVTATSAPDITLACPVGSNIGQLLDQVVSLISTPDTAWYWTVDPWRNFILTTRTATAAPWNIADGEDLFAGDTPYQQSIVQTHNQLANFAYAIASACLLNTINGSYTGNGTATTFNLPEPAGGTPTITLNLNPQTVGVLGVDTGKDWYWSQGSSTVTQDSSGAVLQPSDLLLVSYQPEVPAIAQAPNVASLQQLQAVEGTSATYEHSFNVSQPILPADLLALATAYEIEYGSPATTCQLYTLRPGLKTGQLQTIVLADAGIPAGSYLIATVQMSLTNNVIVWQYTAFGGANIGDAITALVQFINRQQGIGSIVTPTVPITTSDVISSPAAITIDHTKVPSPLNDFPVLISGTYAGPGSPPVPTPDLRFVGNGGQVQNVSGFDILFWADIGLTQMLDFEIDSYDPVTGNIAFWVKVPSISSVSDTVIYMSWGNASITTSQENIPGTWSNGFVSVYHFGAHGGNDSLGSFDFTVTDRDFTAAGQIEDGMGSAILGTVQTANGAALTPDTLTVSAWCESTGSSDYQCIAEVDDGTNGWSLNLGTGFKLAASVGGTAYDGTGAYTLTSGVWALVAMTFAAIGDLIGYVNGATDDTLVATAYTHPTAPLTCSTSDPFGSFGHRTFHGTLDELHIANVVRTAGWMAAEFNNQDDPATFYLFGSPQPPAQIVDVQGNPQGTVTHSAGPLTSGLPVLGNGGGDVRVGVAGQLVPAGGTTGQVLTKSGNADYAVDWAAPSAGAPDIEINGTSVACLVKVDGTPLLRTTTIFLIDGSHIA